MNNLQRLIDIGFKQIGKWVCNPDLQIERNFKGKRKNVLYAFVVDGEPMYVGKAGDFMGVMNAYRHPGKRSTRIRIKQHIIDRIEAQCDVNVYMFEQTEDILFRGIKLNLCHALEEEIINIMNLEWNIIGKPKQISSIK
jgi:hypothetical protein